MKRVVLLLVLVMSACSTGGSSNSLINATVGDYTVLARDFGVALRKMQPNLARDKTHTMFVITPKSEKKPGDPGYRDCYPTLRDYEQCLRENGSRKVTRSAAINAVSAAVASSPNCSWSGFDSAYDMRARAAGMLARGDDYRVLFAALNC